MYDFVMGITAKELSKRLKLSEAAVSMALNNKPGVSTQTRKRILAAAEKYGYDFTRVSRKTVKNGSITFVIFKRHGAVVSDTPFFSEMTEGVQQKCSEYGYKLSIEHFYKDHDPKKQLDEIRNADPSGLILLGTEMDASDFALFSILKKPIVLLDVYMRDVEIDCVSINNVQGAYLATDYIIRSCSCQPGYLHSAYHINNFEERADGFYKAVRAHGLSSSKSIVHRLMPSIEGAYADMLEVIESGEELAKAYFADNDWIAIGAVRALQEKGYSVPEEISVIGFDNIPLCNYIRPPLTTINVPKKYMGEMAVERLVSLLNTRQFVPMKMEVNTNLVERNSVKQKDS